MVSKSRIGGHPTQDESFDFNTLINSPYKEDSSMASPGYVTHDQLRDFGDKIEERFEKRFDKMDARLDRTDANITEMSKDIVALTTKLDNIPKDFDLVRSNVKNDIHEMMKEQNKEMKNSARFWAGLTITAIPVFFLLFEKFSPILSAASEAAK